MDPMVAIISRDSLVAKTIPLEAGATHCFDSVESFCGDAKCLECSAVAVDLRDPRAIQLSWASLNALRVRVAPQTPLIAITSGGLTPEQAEMAVLFADRELDLLDVKCHGWASLFAPLRTKCRPHLFTVADGATGSIQTFSSSYRAALDRMRSVASAPIPILITGETGTGKSTAARGLHNWSCRANEPFMILPCGAVPGELFESDLFGHTRGAFTSANQNRIGRLEAVGGGTLFLDEVDLLQLEQQAKLLRAVETGEFEPVGSTETRTTNARFIFASNVDLPESVAEQRFRADLYYRINVIDLKLPALRERREDIPILAVKCLSEACAQVGRRDLLVTLEFLNNLARYDWPGNIRELKNRLLRAILLSTDGVLREFDLGCESTGVTFRVDGGHHSILRRDRQAVERASIERMLRDHSQNRSAAAKALGISRATLYKKINEYGVGLPNGDR